MDPKFFDIYKDLEKRYRRNQKIEQRLRDLLLVTPPPTPLSVVTGAVDSAEATLDPGKILRPDARLFLTVSLHQMVALPLAHRNSPAKFTDVIAAELRSDAEKIVQAAKESAIDRDDIAASHVLWGTAKVLGELNLKKWRLWERE